MASLKLVVGLGNPGPDYRATRHNAGFRVVECLGAIHQVRFQPGRWKALEASVNLPGVGKVVLLMPQTYMNESGRSVAPLARFYKLAPEDVVVIHDDLDLAPGAVRLKQGGGDGGHNGIKSIVAEWGEREFFRVRLGIGRPPKGANVTNYVLGRPSDAQWKQIEGGVERAAEATEALLRDGLEAAQQLFNRRAVGE